MEHLSRCLDGELVQLLQQYEDRLSEIRIRCGRAACFRLMNGREILGKKLDAPAFQRVLERLMEDGLYSLEEELKQGFFSLPGGVRVGVCGKMNATDGCIRSMANIGSICIRIPREARGCASKLAQRMLVDSGNLLILSAPGLGKTTLLRDLARQLSNAGKNVGIADERREIAGCMQGVPQLDVGMRTDVMDGCPKALALRMLVRSCAPDVLVADEIGGAEDAHALMDAARCGVCIAVSAHAADLSQAMQRSDLGKLIASGLFRYIAQLGPGIGELESLMEYGKEEEDYAQRNAAFVDPDRLCGGGAHALQRAQEKI